MATITEIKSIKACIKNSLATMQGDTRLANLKVIAEIEELFADELGDRECALDTPLTLSDNMAITHVIFSVDTDECLGIVNDNSCVQAIVVAMPHNEVVELGLAVCDTIMRIIEENEDY